MMMIMIMIPERNEAGKKDVSIVLSPPNLCTDGVVVVVVVVDDDDDDG